MRLSVSNGILAGLFLLLPWRPGLVCASDAVAKGVPQFVDVTASAGIQFHHICGPEDRKDYIFEAKGGGIGWFDYNNDGWLDLYLVQGSTVEKAQASELAQSRLYQNNGDGTFVDVTEESRLAPGLWGMGVSFGDYDNDGYTDIYATHLGPNILYRNNGDGTFSNVTEKAGVGDPRWSTSAAFGDYDLDGDLDLYVANYLDYGVDNLPPLSDKCKYLGYPVMCGPRGLRGAADVFYRNNGDGTFTDVARESGAIDKDSLFGLGVLWADVDNDYDFDLIISDDATPNLLFINKGDGTFEEMGFLSGLAVNKDGSEQASMGVDAADFDNDGLLDVYMTHFAADYSTLYRNEGNLIFTDITSEAGILTSDWLWVSWSFRFVDLNLDGWKDILHVNGHVYPFLLNSDQKEEYLQPTSIYLNNKDRTFSDVSGLAGPEISKRTVSRGAAFADYDNDGDIDVAIANMNGSPQLLRNDRTDSNHWIQFRTVGSRSNRDGLGARITVTTGTLLQTWEIKRTVGIYSASDPRAHFGLGTSQTVDAVEIRWPSGTSQRFENIAADKHYVIEESGDLHEDERQVRP